MRGQLSVAFEHRLVAEDRQRLQRHPAGQRVAGVAVRMQEGLAGVVFGIERLVRLVGGEHRRQRHEAGGESLRQAHEVRADRRLLAGEQGAGATEAHRDLVGDEVHRELVAQRAQPAQVIRVIHPHAAGALHQRLDDHRAGFVGVAFEQGAQFAEPARRGLCGSFARFALVGIRRRRQQRGQQQRRVGLAVQRHVADRQRAQRFAVVAAAERDEAGLLAMATVEPVVEAHLQRHFDRGRAVVGVEHAIQSRRRDAHQFLGQPDRRLVGEAGEDHLLQRASLVGQGGGDARIGVAEQVDPPRADPVEVAPALGVDQPGAFAARDRHHRHGAFAVVVHLRAGMPDMPEIALGERGVAVCGNSHPVMIDAAPGMLKRRAEHSEPDA